MSGKELFEAMSFIEDRFVEEAETEAIPHSHSAPWVRAVSAAACLCLIFSVGMALGRNVCPFPLETIPDEPLENQHSPATISPSIPRLPTTVSEATEKYHPGEVPSVILLVDQMTEQGFIGTVAEQVDTDLFEIGTELNVVFSDGTRVEAVLADTDAFKSQTTNYAGCLISVQFIDYDPETGTILVNLINNIEPGKED